jgi:O-antigen ligase
VAAAGPLQEGALALLGYGALLLYLFVYLSRILDITLPYLRIPLILNVVFAGAVVVSGGVAGFFRSRIGLLMVALYGWMALCVPFSVWKRGSVETMVQAFRSLVLMAAIIALATTARRCLRIMHTIGLAALVAAGVSAVAGGHDLTERLILVKGSFADPNYYCLLLYLGLPFLWLRARITKHPLGKALYLVGALWVLAAGAATGSRTGLAALCASVAVLFFRASAGRKLQIVLVSVTLVLLAGLFVSDYILQRYTTYFSVTPREGLTEKELGYLEAGAVGSTEGRLQTLRRSLELTARHPLFGVGPGMFPVAEHEDAKAQGRQKGAWLETHNSLTQISSETGLPGLFLYAAILILAARSTSRLSTLAAPLGEPYWEKVRNAARYLQASFFGALAGAMFLSIAYQGILFVLLGLIVALEQAVAREFRPKASPPG